MAFQDFDHISERRRNERKQKLRKRIIIAIVAVIFMALIVAAGAYAFAYKKSQEEKKEEPKNNKSTQKGSKKSSPPPPPAKDVVHPSEKAIKMICEPTDYKKACEASLTEELTANSSAAQPKDLIKAAISVTSADLIKAMNETSKLNFETPETKGAHEDCNVLLGDALEELNSSMAGVDDLAKLSSNTPDLNNWLSAVMSYQQTCIDGFQEGELKTSMKKALNSTQELTSNALAIIAQSSSILSTFKDALPTSRHLLYVAEDDVERDGGLPTWISQEDRRMLKAQPVKLTPNAVVAKDGSGNFTTISAALAAIPEKREPGRYVIYVKEGVYEEYVTVTKKMVNITMYGDGSQKTIVTGNKNFVDGVRTFQTATFAAIGDGFMAQSMGFRNTAGPEKHQAVALRVQSDRSIFLNCRMEAFQDTLYAQTHRQFYRGCLIKGTVDFIFGDAAAVFQNCVIYARKPMDNQQNIITAQGRVDRHQTTGIVLQKCRILADETLVPKKATIKTYLGRPWKEYSRTIVMESEIGDHINPEGWLPWEGEFALKTLFYAEYKNEGPGSNVAARVKWPGYKVINQDQAMNFTVGPFLQGESWLHVPDLPIHFGLF